MTSQNIFAFTMPIFSSFFRSQQIHTRLVQEDADEQDKESFLGSSSSLTAARIRLDVTQQSKRDVKVALKTTFLCSIVYLGLALVVSWRIPKMAWTSPDDFCLHHVSQYSPVVRDVKPSWHTQQFNGTFLHENAYRQSAGPEVDAAWDALGVNYRSVVIPVKEAEQTGLRPDQVKVSEEYGGGFPANVEGLHHLHCLNLLRKALHWNYNYYLEKREGPFVNSPYIVRVHTTHCLDILRQVLMCNPDIGVLGQVWWQPEGEPQPLAFVDFNTKHRCRDYEAIRVWAEKHQLPPEKEVNMSHFYEMPKPGDTIYAAIP